MDTALRSETDVFWLHCVRICVCMCVCVCVCLPSGSGSDPSCCSGVPWLWSRLRRTQSTDYRGTQEPHDPFLERHTRWGGGK